MRRKLRRDDVRADIEFLERRILEGPGVVEAERRQKAFAHEPCGDAAIDAYLTRVHQHAHRITDEETEMLRRAGRTDDELFEITIAASLGAAGARLDAGLAAIALVYGEGEEH